MSAALSRSREQGLALQRQAAPARVCYLDGGSSGTNVYGAERSLVDLVAGMDAARFRASCAVTQSASGAYAEALRALGVPVIYCGGPRSPVAAAGFTRRVWRTARRAGADLIHVNSLRLNPYGVVVGRALGIPVICYVQAHVSPRAYFARLAFANQAVAVCSEAVAAPWRGMPGGQKRLRVVHYGLDSAGFSFSEEHRRAHRLRLGLDERTFALGVVSRLSPSKKLEHFLRAFQLARMREPRLRAFVAGDAPSRWRHYAEGIRQLPERMGIRPHVVFLGYVRDIGSLYSAFDAVVAPSDEEGLGRVPLEAMAAGRPVIAARAGGPMETIAHGETGLLVPPLDPTALAAAMVRLADDVTLCRKLGAAGRRRVEERFSLASYVRAFERIYEQVLRRPSRAPAACRWRRDLKRTRENEAPHAH